MSGEQEFELDAVRYRESVEIFKDGVMWSRERV